ncbi:hypothetical protein [Kineosporia mesophila]|nr:hypothetical protein [Kineosporia mesophila]MCD5353658.1 hypothetical protein [Kineosporia mesophila]
MTHILVVAKTHWIISVIGTRKAVELAIRLKPEVRSCLSAGKSTKGER